MYMRHLFKPKTKKTTFDELVLNFVQAHKYGETKCMYFDGSPLYIYKTDSTVRVQHGNLSMRMMALSDFYNGKEYVERIEITFHTFSARTEKFWHSECIKISFSTDTVYLCESGFRPHSETSFRIEVPFEMLNEVDIFQAETLNPTMPISGSVLVKLANTLIKEIKNGSN